MDRPSLNQLPAAAAAQEAQLFGTDLLLARHILANTTNYRWVFETEQSHTLDGFKVEIDLVLFEPSRPASTVGRCTMQMTPGGVISSSITIEPDHRNKVYRYGPMLHTWALRYFTEQHTSLFTYQGAQPHVPRIDYSTSVVEHYPNGVFADHFARIVDYLDQGLFHDNTNIDLTIPGPGTYVNYLKAAAWMPHFKTIYLHFKTLNMRFLPRSVTVYPNGTVHVELRPYGWLRNHVPAARQATLTALLQFTEQLYYNC